MYPVNTFHESSSIDDGINRMASKAKSRASQKPMLPLWQMLEHSHHNLETNMGNSVVGRRVGWDERAAVHDGLSSGENLYMCITQGL